MTKPTIHIMAEPATGTPLCGGVYGPGGTGVKPERIAHVTCAKCVTAQLALETEEALQGRGKRRVTHMQDTGQRVTRCGVPNYDDAQRVSAEWENVTCGRCDRIRRGTPIKVFKRPTKYGR